MSSAKSEAGSEDVVQRQAMMRLCAEATVPELDAVLDRLAPVPASKDLRVPETGLAMLRGRAAGDGAAFNLGEATVTRAAVSLEGIDRAGFAYHLGRDAAKARKAAILDALWQQDETRQSVSGALQSVRCRVEADRLQAARRSAATRVNFFTLARGDS